jgi:hypothetical protein
VALAYAAPRWQADARPDGARASDRDLLAEFPGEPGADDARARPRAPGG